RSLNQVDDLLGEVRKTIESGDRVLVTTLTKRMAEDLADYMRELGIACRYLHADINTIERVEILRGLRRGDFDVLIGINLLREGLDLVEVGLVAILDADKEGFLRSTRSLIQTMGRAARNINGRCLLYADKETDSIKDAVAETERRRKIQHEFNEKHGIVPTSAHGREQAALIESEDESRVYVEGRRVEIPSDPKAQAKLIESLKRDMFESAAKREFERAAELRDAISEIQKELLK
ncbi:MAG: UvrB/UvrC motif-containing protein, partial [Bdellovibrionales bacterium]|nr:UvrB/UvrC motif-containing protein [Bdellovibrionales bacterium]